MEQDRPIQAGDWVECVDAGTGTIVQRGVRYPVQRGADSSGFLVVNDAELHPWRFKRVDGPHPVKASEPGAYEPMECCGRERDRDGGPNPHCECPAPMKAHDGPVVVVRDGHGNIDTVPQCGGCSAPATNGAWCAYCACSTNGGRQDRGVTDRIAASATGKSPRMVEPGKRLEAALRREAERPRGNPAERKSLAAGHPAMWPSIGDDEP